MDVDFFYDVYGKFPLFHLPYKLTLDQFLFFFGPVTIRVFEVRRLGPYSFNSFLQGYDDRE